MNIKVNFDNIVVKEDKNDFNVKVLMLKGEQGDVSKAQLENVKTNLQSQINSLASGSPLVASSVSEMTDTTRVYVNTTDGYWYYYDGDSWEQGGIYQATSIGDRAIDILNLDDNLQANFNTYFSDDIDLGNANVGYAYPNGSNQIAINSNSGYSYYMKTLNANTIYEYNGSNHGTACGLLVTDNDGNIIYNSNENPESGNDHGTSLIFRINQANCTAYITKRNGAVVYNGNYGVRLRTLIDVSNNLKINTNVRLLNTFENGYTTTTAPNNIRITTDNVTGRFMCYVYSYEKGKSYHLESYNLYSARGINITNNNGEVIYSSSSSSVSNPTYCEYDFTATTNGYIFISIPTGYNYVVEQVYDAIEVNTKNKFYGKKIGADGDSISAGASSRLSYITQLANSNNCTLQNLSVGGGTIAANTYSGGNPRHWICTSVNNLDSDCDLIMLSGGVNDYWNKVPMGTITNDYTSTLDPTTFYGALETMCRNVLDRFRTQKIVFVTYHKINNIANTNNSSTGEIHTFKDYLDAIYEVMNKYSIPVIDINSNTRFNTGIDYYKTNYTDNSDGVHPTTEGYALFYNDYIVNELNNRIL